MKYNSRLNLLFFLLTAFLMPSCQDDITATPPAETGGGLYVSFDMPTVTRSDLATEVAIKTLHAIYFVYEGSGDYKYYGYSLCNVMGGSEYRMTGYPTTNYPSATSDYRMKVMFVANAGELFSSPSWTNANSFATVEDGLIITSPVPTQKGIWGESAEMGSKGAPMYVCTGTLKLIPSVLTANLSLNELQKECESLATTPEYNLTRAIAKFTINNRTTLSATATAAGRSAFSLKKVQLIRGNNQGYLSSEKTGVPATGLVPSTTSDAYEMRAANASIEVESESTAVEQIVFYAYPAINTKTTAADLSDRDNNCYILLKGEIDGAAETYMLPIAGTLDANKNILTPGSINRNTHYEYLIDGVNEKALEVKVAVESWTDKLINAQVAPDYRKLNVSVIQTNVSTLSRARVYFWSNQPSVSVDDEGRNAGDGIMNWNSSSKYTVSDMFEGLGEDGANIHYNAATGEGYIDIIPRFDLTSTITRYYYRSIYISANGLEREIRITLYYVYYSLAYDYVGTFHRKNQVGERVICMHNTGKWEATVDYPSGGPKDFVLLSASRSIDNRLGDNDHGDAENYPVTDGAGTISGTGNIYFRVGMANVTTENRYAKIIINCPDDTKTTKEIYVRQGEDPDYLMKQSDGSGNGTLNTRPLAVKFSPFNSTDPDFKNYPTSSSFVSSRIQPISADNYFTNYPSQAGAIFQWGGMETYAIFAYNPVLYPSGDEYLNWIIDYSSNKYWKDLVSTTETCPYGYRRPKDMSDDNTYNSSGNISNSEIRQSLWLNPQTGTGDNGENSIWGYYADGYFDRKQIATQPASPVNETTYSAVSYRSANVAYFGQLFFNPNNSASLFFPSAGFRSNGDLFPSGYLANINNGYYWTSSSYSETEGWCMRLSNSSASMDKLERNYGISIRCVQNP